LVQDRGGAEFETGGILLYVEDLKRGTNKDIGPKDIFEMASIYIIKLYAVKYNLMDWLIDGTPRYLEDYPN